MYRYTAKTALQIIVASNMIDIYTLIFIVLEKYKKGMVNNHDENSKSSTE